jgi:GT2 family glycosyltransferase
MAQLTIVIPTLRRRESLSRVLDRLERQAGDFQVVVVADAEEPDSSSIDARDRGYPMRVFRAERAGASAARNLGWHAASTPLVLFIGDDMLPAPDLVAAHLEWHAREPAPEVAVLGHVRWARSLRVTPFMRWIEHGMQFDYPSIEGVDAGWGRFYTANVSLKRDLLEAAGGFDEDFPIMYEDLDLARRLHDRGLRLLYNRRAVVEHDHPATIADWRDRMKVVAAAERRFTEKHPDVEPYFLPRFAHLATLPRARGRGAKLVRWVPRSVPLLGRKVWESADIYYGQQLAPAFLDAWRENG